MLHRFACATGPRLISSLMKTFSLPSLKFSVSRQLLFFWSKTFQQTQDSTQHKEWAIRAEKFSNRPKSSHLEFADACGVRNEQTNTLGNSMLNPKMLNAGDSAQIMHLYFKTQIKCARKYACKPYCELLGMKICFQFNDHVIFYRDLHNARTKKQQFICEKLCESYKCCIQSTVSIMIKTETNSWCLGKTSCLLYCLWHAH